MATIVHTPFGPVDIDTGEAQTVNSATAIFNPALKGKIKESETPCVVLAVDGGDMLTVDPNGDLRWLHCSFIRLDWHYDFKTERWVDASGASLEDEPEE